MKKTSTGAFILDSLNPEEPKFCYLKYPCTKCGDLRLVELTYVPAPIENDIIEIKCSICESTEKIISAKESWTPDIAIQTTEKNKYPTSKAKILGNLRDLQEDYSRT